MTETAEKPRGGLRAELGTIEVPKTWPWLFLKIQNYCARYAAKNFHAVRLSKSGGFPILKGPTVFVANHPGWWDPVICFVLSRRWPERINYGPMESAALKQYPFFDKVGLFGVETGTLQGATKFLQTSWSILRLDNANLWITAQGQFTDPRVRPIKLRSGVGHLAAELPRGYFVPLAIEYPFWHQRTPEAVIRFGPPIDVAVHPGLRARQWTALLEREMQANQDVLAQEAISQNENHFHILIKGRVGVGGMYDRWRKLSAWVRGQTFNPAHDMSHLDARHG